MVINHLLNGMILQVTGTARTAHRTYTFPCSPIWSDRTFMDRKQYAVASGRTRITAPPRGSKRMALAGHGFINRSFQGSFGDKMSPNKTRVFWLVGWLIGWLVGWLVSWLVVGFWLLLLLAKRNTHGNWSVYNHSITQSNNYRLQTQLTNAAQN